MIMTFEFEALPLERFTRSGNKLIAELSDFGPCRETYGGECGLVFMKRLYNDACDVGIGIRSHYTNKVIRFFWREDLGRNNDYSLGYQQFEFEICSEDAKHSNIKYVTIFND